MARVVHCVAAVARLVAALLLSAGLLVPGRAVADPARVHAEVPSAEEDFYVDPLGHRLRFSHVYWHWFGQPRERYYVRAGVEMAALLGAGLSYYWIKAEQNTTDWDFPNLEDRLLTLQAVRFDNNLFITNQVLHPASGTLYYGFARANGLSVPEAFVYSAGTSAVFEWWLEWLEKVSINDLVFTPAGGWASGEMFFQLGRYLNSAPGKGTWATNTARWSLGAPVALHNAVDHAVPPPALPPDSLGFSSAYWHAFDFAYGLSAVDNDTGRSAIVHDALIGATLVAMPGFLVPGHFERAFGDGNFNEMRVRLSFGRSGWEEVDAFFSSDYAGYYAQHLDATRSGLHGYATMVGLNTAYRFVDRWLLGREDQYAIASVLGPSFKLWLAGGGFTARIEAAASGDAAAIRSLPYDDWRTSFGEQGTKTTLQRHNYYLGLGTSARFRARVQRGGAELGASLGVGVYDSVDGLDREQVTVTRDVHNLDQIMELGAWLALSPPRSRVRLGVSGEQTFRRSQMAPLVSEQWDRRIQARAGFRF